MKLKDLVEILNQYDENSEVFAWADVLVIKNTKDLMEEGIEIKL